MEALKLEVIESQARTAQDQVAVLLDHEESALRSFEEISAIAETPQRLDEAARLLGECESLVSLAKELGEVLGRVRKRMAGVIEKVEEAVLQEVENEGGEVETRNWILKSRVNPPSVVVDDLSIVPKKYRSEPAPIPPPEEWPVDKNMVKNALTKEKVQSILGVHISQSSRLEIKPR